MALSCGWSQRWRRSQGPVSYQAVFQECWLLHPLHTKGPFLDLLHSRQFAFEKHELLSNLGVGYEMSGCPIHAAGESAPPQQPTWQGFTWGILPGTYALSSVRQWMSARFLAGRKTGLCTVRSLSPTSTHSGTALKELRVGIRTPCKQRKQRGRKVRTGWSENTEAALLELWRGAAKSSCSP